MTTDYDPIAEQYRRSKQQPWRTFIESFTLRNLAGEVAGLSVLDVACGEGFYTRLLRQGGARRVVGVDLSAGMIELARQQEAQHGLGIEYVQGDARELPLEGPFDLAVAAYLLNYATNRDELQQMCQGIARVLRPGGRFVTVNCSSTLEFPAAPSYEKYGFETLTNGAWQEGSPITWRFHLEDGAFEIENYFLDVAIHEEAFRQAGFREVCWHPPQLAPESVREGDAAFWADFMNHSPVSFIECVK